MTKAEILIVASFFILPPFLAVVLASFVQWRFAPIWEWTEEGRAAFLFIWMVSAAFLIGPLGGRK